MFKQTFVVLTTILTLVACETNSVIAPHQATDTVTVNISTDSLEKLWVGVYELSSSNGAALPGPVTYAGYMATAQRIMLATTGQFSISTTGYWDGDQNTPASLIDTGDWFVKNDTLILVSNDAIITRYIGQFPFTSFRSTDTPSVVLVYTRTE